MVGLKAPASKPFRMHVWRVRIRSRTTRAIARRDADVGNQLPRANARGVRWAAYCALGAPAPVSFASSSWPSGNLTEPPLADNDPSRAR